MRKRGDVSSKAKAQAALEALKGLEPIGVIVRRYKVHPIQVGKWRKRLLEEVHQLFENGDASDTAAHEREVQELYEQIGRLKVENDFLKKIWSQQLMSPSSQPPTSSRSCCDATSRSAWTAAAGLSKTCSSSGSGV
jgi:transposase